MINMNTDNCDLQDGNHIGTMNLCKSSDGNNVSMRKPLLPLPRARERVGVRRQADCEADVRLRPRGRRVAVRSMKRAQNRRRQLAVGHFHILKFVAKITVLSFAMFTLTSCQQNVAHASNSDTPAIVQSDPQPSAGDPATGRTLFLKNCAHCHGATARGDEGPDLHNLDESNDWIANRIRNGKKGQMTAFAGKLQPAEINSLIAYLRTLK